MYQSGIQWGLALDRLVAAEMVDHAGNVVTATASQQSDLLWAAKVRGRSLQSAS